MPCSASVLNMVLTREISGHWLALGLLQKHGWRQQRHQIHRQRQRAVLRLQLPRRVAHTRSRSLDRAERIVRQVGQRSAMESAQDFVVLIARSREYSWNWTHWRAFVGHFWTVLEGSWRSKFEQTKLFLLVSKNRQKFYLMILFMTLTCIFFLTRLKLELLLIWLNSLASCLRRAESSTCIFWLKSKKIVSTGDSGS